MRRRPCLLRSDLNLTRRRCATEYRDPTIYVRTEDPGEWHGPSLAGRQKCTGKLPGLAVDSDARDADDSAQLPFSTQPNWECKGCGSISSAARLQVQSTHAAGEGQRRRGL